MSDSLEYALLKWSKDRGKSSLKRKYSTLLHVFCTTCVTLATPCSLRCCPLGDAYFFKDNLYWVLKNGGLNQDVVTPKSIAVDWLRCPAPPPTAPPANPRFPKECSCNLKGSSSLLKGSWLLLVLHVLLMVELMGK